jgi:hypothetical protein
MCATVSQSANVWSGEYLERLLSCDVGNDMGLWVGTYFELHPL